MGIRVRGTETMASILPDPANLILEKVTNDDQGILICARSRQTAVVCPKCGSPATKVHSRYVRTVRDLAWSGIPVRIQLRVRRFFCEKPRCPFLVFAEQLPNLVVRYGRRTVRFEDRIADLGLSIGGNPAARLSRRLDGRVSRWTVLRAVRKRAALQCPTPKKLGIDDFAFRKGRRYGTILVDLETRRPVDLLPDRTTETVKNWLSTRKGIQVITRDRSVAYAEAARAGAPKAVQVADRWHLMDNATQTLRDVVTRQSPDVRRTVRELNRQLSPDPDPMPKPERKPTLRQENQRAIREGRIEKKVSLWEDVRAMYAKGVSFREIGRRLGIERHTARKYALAETFPEMARYPVRPKLIDAFTEHIDRRWREGCYRIVLLLKEIHALGYRGKRSGIVRYCSKRWGSRPTGEALPKVIAAPSSRELTWWLLLPEEQLEEEQIAVREAVQEESPDIAAATKLVRRFHALVRKRERKAFDQWMKDAETSSVKELVGFAKSLAGDEAAVRNALSRKWSNGQVEGQINRLKLIKRQMYGRAKFDLLRLRVLYQG